MRTLYSFWVTVILLCGAEEARAAEYRETVAVRLGAAALPRLGGTDADRLTIAAAVRPWRLFEIEGDFGFNDKGGTGGLRAGFAYPLRNPTAEFQLDGVVLAGYRAMMGFDSSERTNGGSTLPGLPLATLLHVAELNAAVDATMWNSPRIGLTVRLFVGALVAPWTSFVGFAPEIGVAAGLAF